MARRRMLTGRTNLTMGLLTFEYESYLYQKERKKINIL